MLEKRTPIPVSQAVEKVMKAATHSHSSEQVHITKAYRRTLAEDLLAKHPVPPFDRTPYDGFAIHSDDSQNASRENPVTLRVIETIGAGSVCEQPVQRGEAVRIMTGAMLPPECDAIVMLELADTFTEADEDYMTIKRHFPSGHNLSYKGEDVSEGTMLIEKGTVINPGTVALLATFGYEYVSVTIKPTIGVFATGSELLEVEDELEPGKIRNSNTQMLLAQIERAGAEAVYFGKLPDEFESCYSQIKEAAVKVDILITTGGVSVGDFDLLPEVYDKLNADILFNKIAMRPGSVTTVATWNDTLMFGLSGNPSACYVGFEVFVRPIIKTRMLSSTPHLSKAKAILSEDFSKANPFTRFVRGTLSYQGHHLHAAPSGFNKSNAVSSLAKTDVFIVLPGGTRGYTKGDLVDILILDTEEGSEWPWESLSSSK